MSMLYVACGFFSAGLYGVLTRRDLIGILASIEVMIGGALVLLVMLGSSASDPASVQAGALLLLVLVASEAAVGLSLLVAVARRMHTTRVDEITEVRG